MRGIPCLNNNSAFSCLSQSVPKAVSGRKFFQWNCFASFALNCIWIMEGELERKLQNKHSHGSRFQMYSGLFQSKNQCTKMEGEHNSQMVLARVQAFRQ